MLPRVTVATGNPDKAKEIASLLEGLALDFEPLDRSLGIEAPEETGDTFEANAVLKATYYATALDRPCVADDSGLEVAALGSAPGVYSARYAGPGCTYADNNAKLLATLAAMADADRSARFVCCAAYAEPGGFVCTTLGEVRGAIALAPRGDRGFGYDPLFVPEGETRTFAEMAPPEKAAISHRASAFEALRARLVLPAQE